MHEIFHWKDAENYRKTIGEITDSSFDSDYSIYQRKIAFQKLKEAGVKLDPYWIKKNVGEYAWKNLIVYNDYEEIYPEYRTLRLLE